MMVCGATHAGTHKSALQKGDIDPCKLGSHEKLTLMPCGGVESLNHDKQANICLPDSISDSVLSFGEHDTLRRAAGDVFNSDFGPVFGSVIGPSKDGASVRCKIPVSCIKLVSAASPSVSDSMIAMSEFKYIQSLIGSPFTWDAACDDKGLNAFCPNYSSPSKSFMASDVSGHQVWCHPPLSKVHNFIHHYKSCKDKNPSGTSAVFILPKCSQPICKHMQGFVLLREYNTGYPLFSAPSRSHGHAKSQLPAPCAYQVWYDPPTARLNKIKIGESKHDPLCLHGTINGNKAKCMLDTGASHIFITKRYCKIHKIKVSASFMSEVQLADDSPLKIEGQCTVRLKCQDYSEDVVALVLPTLVGDVDMILGNTWLRPRSADISYFYNTITIRVCEVEHTLKCNFLASAEQVMSFASSSMCPPELLSAKAYRRAIKKGEKTFVAYVRAIEGQGSVKVVVESGSDSQPHASKYSDLGSNPDKSQIPSSNPDGFNSRSGFYDEHGVALDDFGVPVSHTGLNMCYVSAVGAGDDVLPQQELKELLSEFKDVFPDDLPSGLPPARGVSIRTIPTPPDAPQPHKKMYRLSPAEKAEVERQVTELLAKGFIRPSTSPYSSPVLFVQKKDGSLRMCIDYRALNAITIKNRWPLPRIDDLFDQLSGSKVFTSVDLLSGYHQVPLHSDDVEKSAFTCHLGHFEWLVLSFGLSNCPSTFTRVLHQVFKPYLGKFVMIFIDDIIVYSKTPEEHMKHLRLVLALLRKERLYGKLKKCDFGKRSLKFLGMLVTDEGIAVHPDTVKTIADWSVPTNVKDLRRFLDYRITRAFSQELAARA